MEEKMFFKKWSPKLAALFLVAVASQSYAWETDSVINFKSINTGSDLKVHSAKITDAAERLVYTDGVVFAKGYFDQALKEDPNNIKARFYSGLLTLVALQQGLVKRVVPVVAYAATPGRQADYKSEVRKFPEGYVKRFALNGSANIDSEDKVLVQLQTDMDHLMAFRASLNAMRDSGQTVSLYVPRIKEFTLAEQDSRCPVQVMGDGVFKILHCSDEQSTVRINFADFEALRLMIGGLVASYAPLFGYDMQGVLNVAHRLQNVRSVSQKTMITEVKKEPRLGEVKSTYYLHIMAALGTEASSGYLVLSQIQKACPQGEISDSNRPGYLYKSGFCASPSFKNALVRANLTTQGTQTWKDKDLHGADFTTALNGNPFFTGNVKNISSLLPNRFDHCGKASGLPDETLGGTFPNGDATKAIRTRDADFLQQSCVRNKWTGQYQ
jgi:hypothetical protein